MVYIEMVSLCALSYVLDQPFKYQTSTYEKDGAHLSGIQMAVQYSNTIWRTTSFSTIQIHGY